MKIITPSNILKELKTEIKSEVEIIEKKRMSFGHTNYNNSCNNELICRKATPAAFVKTNSANNRFKQRHNLVLIDLKASRKKFNI